MKKKKDLAQEAVEIATVLLQSLEEYGTDAVTGQAALANAWYRLCKGLKYPPSVFWEMLNGMGEIYENSVKHGKTDT